MPQSELDRVDGYERQQRAAQLWYLRQDFAEGTADAGYLPTVNAIYGKNHGFPEESAAISDLLRHPEGLQNLRDELEQFVQAYRENRELLRFHFHRPQKLLEQLSDLQREPLHFTAAEGYAPQRRFFHLRGRDRQPSPGWKTQHRLPAGRVFFLSQPHRAQGTGEFLKALPRRVQRPFRWE